MSSQQKNLKKNMKIVNPKINFLEVGDIKDVIDEDIIEYKEFDNIDFSSLEDIRDKTFSSCIFKKCKFDNILLSNNDFIDVIFDNIDFSNKSFSNKLFERVIIKNSKCLGTRFNKMLFKNVQIIDSVFKMANFTDCSFNNSLFENSDFTESTFYNSLTNKLQLEKIVLERVYFEENNFEGLDFSSCQINCIRSDYRSVRNIKIKPEQSVHFISLLNIDLS